MLCDYETGEEIHQATDAVKPRGGEGEQPMTEIIHDFTGRRDPIVTVVESHPRRKHMGDSGPGTYETLKAAINALHLDAGFDPFLHSGVVGRSGRKYRRPSRAALADMGYEVR